MVYAKALRIFVLSDTMAYVRTHGIKQHLAAQTAGWGGGVQSKEPC